MAGRQCGPSPIVHKRRGEKDAILSDRRLAPGPKVSHIRAYYARAMRLSSTIIRHLPPQVRAKLFQHREAVKFCITGGFCFVVTVAINYLLRATIFGDKPVSALTVATIISTVVSYVLNREWSFRTRGGRARHYEAMLFFLVSAFAIVVNDIPLYLARYAFDLRVPEVSRTFQEISDFVSGIIIGTALAMFFRLWAYKRFVFPHSGVRGKAPQAAKPTTPHSGVATATVEVGAQKLTEPARVR
jgi:putative flippase GtrA